MGIRAPVNLEMKVAKDDAVDAGLCPDCVYSKRIEGKGQSHYVLCERSFTDPSFPKYPRLPVLRYSAMSE